MGTGKNAFLSFPIPLNFDTFFPFLTKNGENGRRKGWNGKRKAGKIWKEAVGPFLLFLDPQIRRDPNFYAIQNPFLPLSKPVLDPFPNLFLPLFFLFLVFFVLLAYHI